MRWILALLISFCLTGSVFAQTPSPETTPPAYTPQKLLLEVNTFNPWAIMMDDMTKYQVVTFSLYDDGLLIYYGVNPADDTDYNY
ncbi:MAG TPA: hypothetical protein PLZ51_05685, partial [Aggregatilineales bacterium]|nr:hypothetical protein [Aggregatilineales bacterium]